MRSDSTSDRIYNAADVGSGAHKKCTSRLPYEPPVSKPTCRYFLYSQYYITFLLPEIVLYSCYGSYLARHLDSVCIVHGSYIYAKLYAVYRAMKFSVSSHVLNTVSFYEKKIVEADFML